MDIQAFGGRKFLLAVLTQVVSTILQWNGKLDPAGLAYATLIGGTVGAFIIGAVAENKHNVQAGQPKDSQ